MHLLHRLQFSAYYIPLWNMEQGLPKLNRLTVAFAETITFTHCRILSLHLIKQAVIKKKNEPITHATFS